MRVVRDMTPGKVITAIALHTADPEGGTNWPVCYASWPSNIAAIDPARGRGTRRRGRAKAAVNKPTQWKGEH